MHEVVEILTRSFGAIAKNGLGRAAQEDEGHEDEEGLGVDGGQTRNAFLQTTGRGGGKAGHDGESHQCQHQRASAGPQEAVQAAGQCHGAGAQ